MIKMQLLRISTEKGVTLDMPSDDDKEDEDCDPSEESDDEEISLVDVLESKAFKQRGSTSAETVQVWTKGRKCSEYGWRCCTYKR